MVFRPNISGAFMAKLLYLITLPTTHLLNKPTEKSQLRVCGYITITHLSGIGSATTTRHPASRTAKRRKL